MKTVPPISGYLQAAAIGAGRGPARSTTRLVSRQEPTVGGGGRASGSLSGGQSVCGQVNRSLTVVRAAAGTKRPEIITRCWWQNGIGRGGASDRIWQPCALMVATSTETVELASVETDDAERQCVARVLRLGFAVMLTGPSRRTTATMVGTGLGQLDGDDRVVREEVRGGGDGCRPCRPSANET